MKTQFLFLLLIIPAILFSQEVHFIKSDTYLYSSNSTSSPILGYFKYGAGIILLSENNNGWYKVKADNSDEGFVPSNYIVSKLFGNDIKNIDSKNPIIEGGDDYYYGSAHLFVIVAGLKTRALPDKTSKSKQILTTGEPVGVDYLTINPEGWVNISGSIDPNNSEYVQRKYLGNRPDFDALTQQFDQLDKTNIAERKTISERLVELAWNSKYALLVQAYERYYQVVKQLNDSKLIAETELNMLLANKLTKSKSDEEILSFSKNIELVLKGVKSKGFCISFKDLIKAYGNPSKKEKVSDECGVYLSDLFYHYPDLNTSVDIKQNLAEIDEIVINANNKLFINSKNILDNTTTETDFITKFGSYCSANIKVPHTYYISLDGGTIFISFKEGKLYSVGIGYEC